MWVKDEPGQLLTLHLCNLLLFDWIRLGMEKKYLIKRKLIILILGDITQKGYEKKKAKLLMPYVNSQKAAGNCNLLSISNL